MRSGCARRAIAAAALLGCASFARAQTYVQAPGAIPFLTDSAAYAEPLCGGLNAPMHQFADLDQDGDPDLWIYDNDFYAERLFFRNTGTPSAPSFSWEPGGGFAGSEFGFWFRLADYDGDGVLELMTDDNATGVRAWRNDGPPSAPVWSVEDSTLRDTSGAPLIAGFGGLPAFADFDGDSLADFLSGNPADGSFNYYRNIGVPGTPAYTLVTNRLSGIIITSDTCSVLGAGPAVRDAADPGEPMHGAGAVALEDIDGNGTLDVFYGDLFSHSLFHIRNAGTAQIPALVCESDVYPPDSSLATIGFNQATFTDIDADGDADLFVSVLNSRTRGSFWAYRNNGGPGLPLFDLLTREFLPTVDAGQNSRPAVADLDGDLDADVILGTNDGGLWHFSNEGSQLSPIFHLRDTAFGGITGGFSYAPALADLDADGDPDLALGRFDGTVVIYRNGGAGVFEPSDTVTAGQFAAPSLGDADGDGDYDLAVGRGDGTLGFWRNTGTSAAFEFTLEFPAWLGVDFGDNAAPSLRFNPATGRTDLYVATATPDTMAGRRGRIYAYRNDGGPPDSLVPWTDRFGPDVPFVPAPAFVDADGDGDDDLLVGTSKGGLVYYRNDTPSRAPDRRAPGAFALMQNYPNPFNGGTSISVELRSPARVVAVVFDAGGRRVAVAADARMEPGLHRIGWDATGMPSGAYFCRVTAGDRSGVIRMSLIK